MEALLKLSGFGVSFGNRVILKNVDLEVSDRGIVIVMGPSGTGKSTLLRTLSGLNDASPSLQKSGQVYYQGEPLESHPLPAILIQKTRLMMATLRENIINDLPERHSLQQSQQRDIVNRLLCDAGLEYLAGDLERCVIDLTLGEQRLVALIRAVAANPKIVLVDEPTAGISDKEAQRILDYLAVEGKKRAIVTVLHNQKQARRLGGTVVLLAGGRIVETQPTDMFFSAPQTQLGQDFVRTGSCCTPSPDACDEEIDEQFVAPETIVEPPQKKNSAVLKRTIRSDAFGPRGFLWLRKGQLAGTPRPGLMLDLELDLQALKRVGVTVLVSLESEVNPIDQSALGAFGIRGIALPIKDMKTPALEDAAAMCEQTRKLIEQGESVAFHCKAGIGRTGTMLVAYMIWEGVPALDALEKARKIEPRWVQSQEQVNFLEQFEVFSVSRFGDRQKEEGVKSPYLF